MGNDRLVSDITHEGIEDMNRRHLFPLSQV